MHSFVSFFDGLFRIPDSNPNGKATINGDQYVPDYGSLYMGLWFPNAWAGSPNFDTCEMRVSSVKVYP